MIRTDDEEQEKKEEEEEKGVITRRRIDQTRLIATGRGEGKCKVYPAVQIKRRFLAAKLDENLSEVGG